MYLSKERKQEFILKCVNKGFEVANTGKQFATFDDLVAYSKEHPEWFQEAVFNDINQYLTYKDFFITTYKQYKPRASKKYIKHEFAMFYLAYGPVTTFDEKDYEKL